MGRGSFLQPCLPPSHSNSLLTKESFLLLSGGNRLSCREKSVTFHWACFSGRRRERIREEAFSSRGRRAAPFREGSRLGVATGRDFSLNALSSKLFFCCHMPCHYLEMITGATTHSHTTQYQLHAPVLLLMGLPSATPGHGPLAKVTPSLLQ